MSKQVYTTEQTGKAWKVVQIVGLVAVVGSLTYCTQTTSTQDMVHGWTIGILGVVAYIVGKAGAWWYHG